MLSPYPPTACGLATFSAALTFNLNAQGVDVNVVRVADAVPSTSRRVVGELVNGSPVSVTGCSELLNRNDAVIIQHSFGTYGGRDGDEIVDILDDLCVPTIVIAHAVIKNPSPQQRSVLEAIAARADRMVVMSGIARQMMCRDFAVEPWKVTTIMHGAHIPVRAAEARRGRPTLLTWGLLGPGKGIERVIDAMRSVQNFPGRPRYLVAGRTHPKELAANGEAYRDARVLQAQELGLSPSVDFDPAYRSIESLTALIQSATVVVLPYDSLDQTSSGVLADAIANGRPVVATAFPHAIDLLGSGAGIVVGHNDPDALVGALREILTQPRLAGTMSAAARRLAPEMSWAVVANKYIELACQIIAQRRQLK